MLSRAALSATPALRYRLAQPSTLHYALPSLTLPAPGFSGYSYATKAAEPAGAAPVGNPVAVVDAEGTVTTTIDTVVPAEATADNKPTIVTTTIVMAAPDSKDGTAQVKAVDLTVQGDAEVSSSWLANYVNSLADNVENSGKFVTSTLASGSNTVVRTLDTTTDTVRKTVPTINIPLPKPFVSTIGFAASSVAATAKIMTNAVGGVTSLGYNLGSFIGKGATRLVLGKDESEGKNKSPLLKAVTRLGSVVASSSAEVLSSVDKTSADLLEHGTKSVVGVVGHTFGNDVASIADSGFTITKAARSAAATAHGLNMNSLAKKSVKKARKGLQEGVSGSFKKPASVGAIAIGGVAGATGGTTVQNSPGTSVGGDGGGDGDDGRPFVLDEATLRMRED